MTLQAVPNPSPSPITPEDRRGLDRRAPAFIVEEHDGTRTTWTVCTRFNGQIREVFARDGMDARRIKALHSSLAWWTPETGAHDPVREALVLAMRDHPTDPLATPTHLHATGDAS